MRDVADHLGVSVSTVSLALRDDPRISDNTRRQVRAAAAEVGYTTNLVGALLRSTRPRVIGVVCRGDQELHGAYVDAIRREVTRRGYHTVIQQVSSSLTGRQALAEIAQMRCPALIVVDPLTVGDAACEDAPAPVVTIGQSAWAGGDVVVSDHEPGLNELVAHLREQGHRRLTYLAGPDGDSGRARADALTRAVTGTGLAMEIVPAGPGIDDGYRAVADYVPGERARALVAYNDQCAIGALLALVRSGHRVPEDVAVAGVDNLDVSATAAIDLTTIDRSVAEVSALAVERALARAEGETPEAVRLCVPTSLVVRGSTGA